MSLVESFTDGEERSHSGTFHCEDRMAALGISERSLGARTTVGFAGRVWPSGPPHSFYPHRNQSVWGRAPAVAGHFVVWPTPSIGLKIGSWYPKRSRKDSGRGSGSPLTRAFTGSKPHARNRPSLSTSACTVHGFPWSGSDPRRGAPNGQASGLTARASLFAHRSSGHGPYKLNSARGREIAPPISMVA
ncbi:hypothetical protein HD554DRAFT_1785391 [Boletus coccyginus]|nr:hypothetical protein HD554DRAFT_1785391 [Boletus coccyginus]